MDHQQSNGFGGGDHNPHHFHSNYISPFDEVENAVHTSKRQIVNSRHSRKQQQLPCFTQSPASPSTSRPILSAPTPPTKSSAQHIFQRRHPSLAVDQVSGEESTERSSSHRDSRNHAAAYPEQQCRHPNRVEVHDAGPDLHTAANSSSDDSSSMWYQNDLISSVEDENENNDEADSTANDNDNDEASSSYHQWSAATSNSNANTNTSTSRRSVTNITCSTAPSSVTSATIADSPHHFQRQHQQHRTSMTPLASAIPTTVNEYSYRDAVGHDDDYSSLQQTPSMRSTTLRSNASRKNASDSDASEHSEYYDNDDDEASQQENTTHNPVNRQQQRPQYEPQSPSQQDETMHTSADVTSFAHRSTQDISSDDIIEEASHGDESNLSPTRATSLSSTPPSDRQLSISSSSRRPPPIPSSQRSLVATSSGSDTASKPPSLASMSNRLDKPSSVHSTNSGNSESSSVVDDTYRHPASVDGTVPSPNRPSSLGSIQSEWSTSLRPAKNMAAISPSMQKLPTSTANTTSGSSTPNEKRGLLRLLIVTRDGKPIPSTAAANGAEAQNSSAMISPTSAFQRHSTPGTATKSKFSSKFSNSSTARKKSVLAAARTMMTTMPRNSTHSLESDYSNYYGKPITSIRLAGSRHSIVSELATGDDDYVSSGDEVDDGDSVSASSSRISRSEGDSESGESEIQDDFDDEDSQAANDHDSVAEEQRRSQRSLSQSEHYSSSHEHFGITNDDTPSSNGNATLTSSIESSSTSTSNPTSYGRRNRNNDAKSSSIPFCTPLFEDPNEMTNGSLQGKENGLNDEPENRCIYGVVKTDNVVGASNFSTPSQQRAKGVGHSVDENQLSEDYLPAEDSFEDERASDDDDSEGSERAGNGSASSSEHSDRSSSDYDWVTRPGHEYVGSSGSGSSSQYSQGTELASNYSSSEEGEYNDTTGDRRPQAGDYFDDDLEGGDGCYDSSELHMSLALSTINEAGESGYLESSTPIRRSRRGKRPTINSRPAGSEQSLSLDDIANPPPGIATLSHKLDGLPDNPRQLMSLDDPGISSDLHLSGYTIQASALHAESDVSSHTTSESGSTVKTDKDDSITPFWKRNSVFRLVLGAFLFFLLLDLVLLTVYLLTR